MSDGLLREELVQWVTRYKDVAERNALAETPEETADYLLSLLPPVRAHTLREVGEWLGGLKNQSSLTTMDSSWRQIFTKDLENLRNGIMPEGNDE